jgi:hypothetical protein
MLALVGRQVSVEEQQRVKQWVDKNEGRRRAARLWYYMYRPGVSPMPRVVGLSRIGPWRSSRRAGSSSPPTIGLELRSPPGHKNICHRRIFVR